MSVIACDPGASGGFAWIDADGIVHASAMPDTEGDVVDFLRSRRAEGCRTITIEDVSGFAGVGHPGSAMFQFGKGVGILHGAAMAFTFRIELVKAAKWQKHFSLGTARECASKTVWKRKLKAEAQRRFPHLKVTLKTADALLILDYAQGKENK